MPTRNKLIVAGLVVLFVLTGFFREYVFLNLNEQMRVAYYNSPDSHLSPGMQWLSGFSYETLYYLKWPFTLLFSAIFALNTAVIVRILFQNPSFVKLTWIVYAGVFASSLLFFAAGLLIGNGEATYDIARFLAGLIESPALAAILVASFLILRRA